MQLFNTMSMRTEDFTVDDTPIGVYVCGVTPYDTTHAGHAFTFLTFDILVRYLRYLGGNVTLVQNVTDIDDDILRKANELGVAWDELARSETERYLDDMRSLNALQFDHFPFASDHIAEILTMTGRLVDSGNAYASNGSVYFSVASDPSFGSLSHLRRDEMLPIANERGNHPDDPTSAIRSTSCSGRRPRPVSRAGIPPSDRVGQAGTSSAAPMASTYLGLPIAVHGGGSDLIFPHHECEIAQAERSSGITPFVKIWMHVGMVEYQGDKMSKSLGNLVIVRDVLETTSSDAFRLYLFSHHYRTVWEFYDDELTAFGDIANDLQEAVAIPTMGFREYRRRRHTERSFLGCAGRRPQHADGHRAAPGNRAVHPSGGRG
jgi:L-cysteine:1D-myo-inositol 2-amino-2-deoxy-alpha-D-glucopyranoside ligase